MSTDARAGNTVIVVVLSRRKDSRIIAEGFLQELRRNVDIADATPAPGK